MQKKTLVKTIMCIPNFLNFQFFRFLSMLPSGSSACSYVFTSTLRISSMTDSLIWCCIHHLFHGTCVRCVCFPFASVCIARRPLSGEFVAEAVVFCATSLRLCMRHGGARLEFVFENLSEDPDSLIQCCVHGSPSCHGPRSMTSSAAESCAARRHLS